MNEEYQPAVQNLVQQFSRVLQAVIEHEKDEGLKWDMWPDNVASHVRKELKRNPFGGAFSSADSASTFMNVTANSTEHPWFAELIRSLVSCYVLRSYRPNNGDFSEIIPPDVHEQSKQNLEGEFNETQAKSLSGDEWSKRLIETPSEEMFWDGCFSAIERYFEYAFSHPDQFRKSQLESGLNLNDW